MADRRASSRRGAWRLRFPSSSKPPTRRGAREELARVAAHDPGVVERGRRGVRVLDGRGRHGIMIGSPGARLKSPPGARPPRPLRAYAAGDRRGSRPAAAAELPPPGVDVEQGAVPVLRHRLPRAGRRAGRPRGRRRRRPEGRGEQGPACVKGYHVGLVLYGEDRLTHAAAPQERQARADHLGRGDRHRSPTRVLTDPARLRLLRLAASGRSPKATRPTSS